MNKILNDYQGESIKINGVCYTFIGETTSSVNTNPEELGGTYDSCLECALESSSSSQSESSSSSYEFQTLYNIAIGVSTSAQGGIGQFEDSNGNTIGLTGTITGGLTGDVTYEGGGTWDFTANAESSYVCMACNFYPNNSEWVAAGVTSVIISYHYNCTGAPSTVSDFTGTDTDSGGRGNGTVGGFTRTETYTWSDGDRCKFSLCPNGMSTGQTGSITYSSMSVTAIVP